MELGFDVKAEIDKEQKETAVSSLQISFKSTYEKAKQKAKKLMSLLMILKQLKKI